MKKIKSSPLKQLEEGGAMGADPQEHMRKSKSQIDSGLDIIGGGAKRLSWEEMQLDIKNIEPDSMKRRKMIDQILRDKEKKKYESGAAISVSNAYVEVGFDLVNQYKNELLEALNNDDKEAQGMVKTKLAKLSNTLDIIKQNIEEFYDDHFTTESLLSKGVSQQQVSFATQMYCDNPDLTVVYAVEEDILA